MEQRLREAEQIWNLKEAEGMSNECKTMLDIARRPSGGKTLECSKEEGSQQDVSSDESEVGVEVCPLSRRVLWSLW